MSETVFCLLFLPNREDCRGRGRGRGQEDSAHGWALVAAGACWVNWAGFGWEHQTDQRRRGEMGGLGHGNAAPDCETIQHQPFWPI